MKIQNKKAFLNYEISDRLEAGINLTGPEVKAIRLGHADLSGSFVKIIGSEAYLVNAKIFPYQYARLENYDERRTRKLLLHKKEIIALKSKLKGANLAIVPLSIYINKGFIKLELGIGKGLKKFEKKEIKRKKDIQKEVEIEIASLSRSNQN